MRRQTRRGVRASGAMVIIRRKQIPTRVVRAVSYGLVIATLLGLALWGYYRHRATRVPVEVPPPPGEEVTTPAGLDRRTVFATEQELLAPAAFPWSLASISRLPRADVSALAVTRAPKEAELAAGLADVLAAELAEQVPTIARAFTLEASPPYLITPVTVRLEFELDGDGSTAAAAASGAPGELNAPFAERAAHLVFPREAANAAFAATVTLVPYSYERLRATRGRKPVAEDEYRTLFRALQFNSFPVYDTVLAAAPGLLTAKESTAVSFVVGADGHPGRVALEPSPPPEAAEAVAAALAGVYLPKTLAGAEVEFAIGGW